MTRKFGSSRRTDMNRWPLRGSIGLGGVGGVDSVGERSNCLKFNEFQRPWKPGSQSSDIGQIVRHRVYPFRGVIYNVDPTFANTEEWWRSIPEEVRPAKDQPFYHLYAENTESQYVAYVSEQNLVLDDTGGPVSHPQVDELFVRTDKGHYRLRNKPMAC